LGGASKAILEKVCGKFTMASLTLKQATRDLNLNLETAGNVLDAVLKAEFGAVQFVSGRTL